MGESESNLAVDTDICASLAVIGGYDHRLRIGGAVTMQDASGKEVCQSVALIHGRMKDTFCSLTQANHSHLIASRFPAVGDFVPHQS